ncbi:MAG: HEAT repeat domain-containing protein [Labilithrix sp.]
MKHDVFFSDNLEERRAALEACAQLADHERFTLAGEVAGIAKRAADRLAHADESGENTVGHTTELGRAAVALSMLRGEVARNCLQRIADERSYAVKAALARSLRDIRTAEARSILVYLLSDDDAQADALVAIGAAPWPEILPSLIEIAEADDRAARLAARSIARCGATAGPNEANAAASFLFEQLDDESVLFAAADAIVRHGRLHRRGREGPRPRGGRPQRAHHLEPAGGWALHHGERGDPARHDDTPGNRGLGAGVPAILARRSRPERSRCGGPNLPGARSALIWPGPRSEGYTRSMRRSLFFFGLFSVALLMACGKKEEAKDPSGEDKPPAGNDDTPKWEGATDEDKAARPASKPSGGSSSGGSTATSSGGGAVVNEGGSRRHDQYDKEGTQVALKRAARQVKDNCGQAKDENGKAIGPWGKVTIQVALGANGHTKGTTVPPPCGT